VFVDIRIELLQLAVQRYTRPVIAEFLRVPVPELHSWLIGRAVVPETALLSLVDLMDPDRRQH
jgi:hypothetical protein